MPALDKDAIKNLRSDIAEARKREVNFGVCLGKKPDSTVLMTHKSRSAEMLDIPMIWFTCPFRNTALMSVRTCRSPKRLLSPLTSIISRAFG